MDPAVPQSRTFLVSAGLQRLYIPERTAMTHYPRVSIKFCTKCKWNLRAAWYLQELLQTFGEQLGEVALVPFESGVFRVEVRKDESSDEVQIWDRVHDGGFPDSKILKQRVRDALFPAEALGHVDKANKNDGKLMTEAVKEEENKEQADECVECKEAQSQP